jgi:ankyrin repeat protein
VKDNNGNTPLDYAISRNNQQAILDLAANGAKNVLHIGVCKNVIDQLIELGVNINEKTALHIAAMFNYSEVIKTLAKKGVNLNEKNADGETALHVAARNNNTEAIKTLAEQGANLDEKNAKGATALHVAARNNDTEVIKTLAEQGANLDEKNAKGATALHVAARNNNTEAIETLAEQGTNLNEKNAYGDTALHVAVGNKTIEVIKTLAEQGANLDEKNASGETALHVAVRNNNTEVIKTLAEQGANLDEKGAYGETALHVAVGKNNTEAIKILAEQGANLNEKKANGDTPFHVAVWNGNTEVINTLAEQGANLDEKNAFGETALHVAVRNNNTEAIKTLAEQGANINEKNSKGNTVLHVATQNKNIEAFKIIAEKGAHLNEKNVDGETALHVAAMNNNTEAIKILAEQRANLNEKNNQGETALHIAAVFKHSEVIKTLAEKGANLNEKNADGKTALHVVVRNNNTEAIKTLVKQGTNLDEKNNQGKTALHIAAINNNLEAIDILTNLGANLESKDNEGLTPIMCAIKRNADQALKILESRQPNFNSEAYAQRFDLFSIFGGQKVSNALSAINKDEQHDGGFSQRSFSILARELEMYRNHVPVIVEKYDRIIEIYKNSEKAENYSKEDMLTAIKSGQKILLSAGYDRHHITALLEQNNQGDIQLLLIDRGNTSERIKDNADKVNSIRQISIPNDKFGLALDLLKISNHLEKEPACKLLFQELPKQMGVQFNLIPEIAHKPFKEGICFFANPKTAIDYLFRQEFGESLGSTLYKDFTFSMRERQLSSYLNYANSHSLDKNAHNSLREKGIAVLSQKADKLYKIYDALERNDTHPLSIFMKRNDELSNEVLFRLLHQSARRNNEKIFNLICQIIPDFKMRLTNKQADKLLGTAMYPVTSILQKFGFDTCLKLYQGLKYHLHYLADKKENWILQNGYLVPFDVESFEFQIRQAIHEGFDINYCNDAQNLVPLLHLASRQGNLAAMDILCEQGADVNKKTADGTTALHHATAEAAAVLCAKGIDVNVKDHRVESYPSTAFDKVKILLESNTSFDKDLMDDALTEIKKLL